MGTPIANNNYQIYPFFVGTDKACDDATYLLPPSFTYGAPIPFTIPLLYIATEFPTDTSYSNTDFIFQLTKPGSGTPTQANVTVNVTITGTNAWACADSARAALMANYVDFLQNVEAKFELTGILIPGATMRISQWLSDRIPAPPIETLFFRYSFSSGYTPGTKPYVDVRPGMVLRVDSEASQFITPGSTMNGYITTGASPYMVNSAPMPNGGTVVTFDAFLASINAPTITGGTTSPVVAGGVIDLSPPGSLRSYCRLFYPSSIAAPSSPGSTSTASNVTLISAQTLAQMNAATSAYPTCSADGTPANVCTVFLGRAVAVPEVPVWITARGQTQLQYVPLGTTITNIIERFTMVPLNTSQQVVTMVRTTTGGASGSTALVTLFTQGLPAIPSSMFNLPLIAGDGLTFNV